MPAVRSIIVRPRPTDFNKRVDRDERGVVKSQQKEVLVIVFVRVLGLDCEIVK